MINIGFRNVFFLDIQKQKKLPYGTKHDTIFDLKNMFSEKKNEEVKKKRENVTNEIMLVFI